MTTPRPSRSTLQRSLGVAVAACGIALVVRGGLGLGPWTVLSEGLATTLAAPFGLAVALVGAAVLAADAAAGSRLRWVDVAGLASLAALTELLLWMVPEPGPRAIELRCALLVSGVLVLASAKAMIDARPERAPGYGALTWLAARSSRSPAELLVAAGTLAVLAGGLLGGVVNLGTVFAVLVVGPIARRLAPWCALPQPRPALEERFAAQPVGSRACRGSDTSPSWSPSR